MSTTKVQDQPAKPSSTAELFQLERMIKCNCERGFEVLYVCLKKESECPDSSHQRYYCAQCSQEDKHDHKPTMIMAEMTKIQNVWQALITEVNEVNSRAQTAFKELKPVILYIEEAMVAEEVKNNATEKLISADVHKLSVLNEEVNSFYKDQVLRLYAEVNIIELAKLSPQLTSFSNSAQGLSYLNQIDEKMLYEVYQAGIQAAGSKKFSDFSEENLQVFYRLKLKSIEQRLPQGGSMGNLIKQHLQNDIADFKKDILENVDQRTARVEQQMVYINDIAANIEQPQSKVQVQHQEFEQVNYQIQAQSQQIQQLTHQIGQQQAALQQKEIQIYELRQEQLKLQQQFLQFIKESQKDESDQSKIEFIKESGLIQNESQRNFVYPIVQERLSQKFYTKMLFCAGRDGFSDKKFHQLCDNKGPLLVLLKTKKDLVVGGFSSVNWKSSGDFVEDQKCVVFSVTRQKIYKRLNNKENLQFDSDRGPVIGCGFVINNKLMRGWANRDPFIIPKNGAGFQELVEQEDQKWEELKDYEVFACSSYPF